ncbi:MAG: DUF1553 domain-containing protein [Planctomycetota bacterium]|nr:DUF1553 domain-containing protein [Planctomycetota bacterium]
MSMINCVFFVSCFSVLLAENVPDFNRDIRPILSDRCFRCHGPDAKARKVKLRLDVRDDAIRTRGKRTPIVPGQADASELVRRIFAGDPEDIMPPPESKLVLSASEKALLRKWIDSGADYDEHWAFRKIQKPDVPMVKDTERVRTPVDAFILARLEKEGMRMSADATKEKLIRRAAFDITGLPPTLKEIDDFLTDDSPGAFEKVVDEYLRRESYGERMTSEWLDVARYSDTYGYQVDRGRHVWPWRTWVIQAFNSNMPYDRFITEQLAGDLLPNATDDQILATTFNRLHPQKVEGGSTPEEFRIEYVADRTQTFATAFLGITLECARCHDHKYDPFTQKEYYQFSAFFDKIDEAGLYSYFTPSVPTPTLLLTNEAQKKQIAEIEERITSEEKKLAALAKAHGKAFEDWRMGVKKEKPAGADEKALEELEAQEKVDEAGEELLKKQREKDKKNDKTNEKKPGLIPGMLGHFTFDELKGGSLANEADEKTPAATSADNKLVDGKFGKALQLTGDDAVRLKFGNFTRNQPFTISLWMKTPDHKERAVIFHRSRAWTDSASRGYQLLIEDGRLSASLIHFWPGNAIRVRTSETIPLKEWLHVTMAYDGSSRADGLNIFLNGQLPKLEVVRDNLYKNITGGGGDEITIGERFRDRGFTDGLVDEFKVFDRLLTPVEIAQLFDGKSLKELLDKRKEILSAIEQEQLHAFYLATADDSYRAQLDALKNAREARSKAVDGIQEIMVMREMAQPRETYILERGHYAARKEEVLAMTPARLHPYTRGDKPNRLGLSQWITHPDNPLTARVTVNRYWQMFFGRGLVITTNDFGSQGSPPTHPELLDWLARDFMDHGWDLKRLVRLIVTSTVYRQSSAGSSEATGKDPLNLLLARSPRYRLPAEMVRDNALAVSGLLQPNVGSEPAKPYELAVSFKPMGHDKGPGLYRRSLYTYWQRTAPAPVMMALDASKRDVCSVRRETTATPIQAFVFMNDPQFVEAAKKLAERVLEETDGDASKSPALIFRYLTGRRPAEEETKIIVRLFEEELAVFEKQPDKARELLGTGHSKPKDSLSAPRVAALTVTAIALFSHDECVMKR